MASTQHEKPFAVAGQGTIFDGIAYLVSLIGVYVMVGGARALCGQSLRSCDASGARKD